MKVLLDANLATLLVLGSVDRRMIGTHKRIQRFTRPDFDDLTGELVRSEAIVALPNTLTEISNLIGQGVGDRRTLVFERFRRLIEEVDEHYVASLSAARRTEFPRLGLTDSALLVAGALGFSLLTDDDDLYVAALKAGCRARNFRHIQAER
ncbi:hypothetical protein [Methylopila sp. M107]|uniref:hypothetical protein n=1 Tax=Methylopila sp. M107 TaxID=1101190 RepID=UPI000363995B|nr:hypothetical protein [Methylopila sp. M107]